jgi:hypothetical protein
MFMGFHQAAIQAGKISIAVFPASGQLLDPPMDSPCSAAEVAEQLNLAPDVRSWHKCEVSTGSGNVCCLG